MADTVAYLLEEMVPELEDFERRGLFTRAEIKRIVAARTQHEYAMKRRAPVKADFLRAIQYEEKLEALRRHRKRVQNAAAAAEAAAEGEEEEGAAAGSRRVRRRAPAGTSGSGDHAILRRIHFLFTRALRKFRGDLRLWARLFAFCRAHGGSRALSRALASALALHPTQPGLWAYAAAWELRCRRDAPAARALMQRGLRACPASASLWADYFEMELHAAHLLRQRALVLGLPATTVDEAGGDAAAAAAAELEEDQAGGGGWGKEEALRVGRQKLLRGAVAEAVFDAAAAALPKDVQLRLRCLAALERHGWAAWLRPKVLASLAAPPLQFDAQAVAARAGAAGGHAQGCAVFQQALAGSTDGPATELLDAYAAFLHGRHGAADRLQALAHDALRRRGASEQLLLTASRALLAAGRRDEADHTARAACAFLRDAPRVWALRLEMAAEGASREEGDGAAFGHSLHTLCVEALRATPPSSAPPLWRLAQQLCCCLGVDAAPVAAAMARAHAGGAGPLLGDAAACLLRVAAAQSGADAARLLAQQFLALPGPSAELYSAALSLEAEVALAAKQAGAPDAQQALARARRVAEAAVGAHGEAEGALWRDYVRLETAAGGGHAAAGPLLWRARKAMRDASALDEVTTA